MQAHLWSSTMAGLLRGEQQGAGRGLARCVGRPGTGDGYMTPAEVRRLMNLPFIEGSDKLFKAQTGITAKPPKPPADGSNRMKLNKLMQLLPRQCPRRRPRVYTYGRH